MGQCSSCGEWNTLIEEVVQKTSKADEKKAVWAGTDVKVSAAIPLEDVEAEERNRMFLKDAELNRVLGGGLVSGSLILVGGEPGIGKSTLLLQMALAHQSTLLYVSGEESASQIKMRADRISSESKKCLILAETNLSVVLKEAKRISPEILIIDSIQTIATPFLESSPGSIAQVRECTNELQRFAKENNIAILIIGHINKEGSIAGPKLLEHIVDTVLQFEGDKNYSYRLLRVLKNRFGSTEELGIYEMVEEGLRIVSNPSELLLSQSDSSLPGTAVSATVHGGRPLLLETQALVTAAVYGNPQRSATGFDTRRLNMLLAILEKRAALPFGNQDVFLNIAGGIKVTDPSMDLAVAVALCSSLQDIPISSKTCFAAELGLTGEIRAVHRIEQRILEGARLGFEKMYISSFNRKGIDQAKYDIEIKAFNKLEDVLADLFG